MTSQETREMKAEERRFIRGLEFQIQLEKKKLSKLDFQNFTGSYYQFCKLQGAIQNKIDDLNEEIKYYITLMATK